MSDVNDFLQDFGRDGDYCYHCGRALRGGIRCTRCDYGEDYEEPISPERAARIERQRADMRALAAEQKIKRAAVEALPLGTVKSWRY